LRREIRELEDGKGEERERYQKGERSKRGERERKVRETNYIHTY